MNRSAEFGLNAMFCQTSGIHRSRGALRQMTRYPFALTIFWIALWLGGATPAWASEEDHAHDRNGSQLGVPLGATPADDAPSATGPVYVDVRTGHVYGDAAVRAPVRAAHYELTPTQRLLYRAEKAERRAQQFRKPARLFTIGGSVLTLVGVGLMLSDLPQRITHENYSYTTGGFETRFWFGAIATSFGGSMLITGSTFFIVRARKQRRAHVLRARIDALSSDADRGAQLRLLPIFHADGASLAAHLSF